MTNTLNVVQKDIEDTETQWGEIDWKEVEAKVFRLQKRLYEASRQGNVVKVRKLQKTLLRSWYARLLAVRKVTQDNRGKKTAGVDGVKSVEPEKRIELAKNLKLSDKSRATRRVWIPKAGTTEKRPLGIPTMRDRAKQALVKLALEPEWEAKFEPSSYGFRPGRSCQDAIQHIKLAIQHTEKYVFDADISKCFDRINHSALLQKTSQKGKVKRQLKAWLKSGVIDQGVFEETTQGTPQGGVISPLLANIALHGLEEHLKQFARNSKGWRYKSGQVMGRINQETSLTFIRYADDFVVLHQSKEVILECKKIISEWLTDIGLELKPDKTRMTHTLRNEESEDCKAGFDFLGFHIQQYKAGIHKDCLNTHSEHQGFITLITPSKKAIKKHYESIKTGVKALNNAPQVTLIAKLNPIIRGWTNYYRYSDIKTVGILSKIKNNVHWKLRKWGIKRCGSDRDAINNYFHQHGTIKWVFSTGKGKSALKLTDYLDISCSSTKYVKVKDDRSPYDGDWLYWTTRMGNYPEISPTVATLLKKQKGKCTHCGLYFQENDVMEIDHIIATANGGTNQWSNKQLLHGYCHDVKTTKDLKELKETELKTKKLRETAWQKWTDGETLNSEEEEHLNDYLNERSIDEERYQNQNPKKRKKKKTLRKPNQYIKGKKVKSKEAVKPERVA